MALPTDIANLKCWLDFSDISTLYQDDARTTPVVAHADPIGGVTDKSGSSMHATQATAGSRPLYASNQLNTRSVCDLDSTSKWFSLPSLAGLTAGEIFVVVKAGADPGASLTNTLWDLGSSAQAMHYPYSDGILYDDFGTTARKTTGNPTLSLASEYRVYNVVSVSGEWSCWIDGTLHYTTASNTVGFASAPRIGSDSGTRGFVGRIAEIVLFGAKLSGDDKTAMRDYLHNKWFVATTGNRRRRIICGASL